MKILHVIFLFTLLHLPAQALAADVSRIPANSRITSVTVYSDRALTTRSATLDLKPGSYLIAFEALPTLIMDESVRAGGSGTADVTITGLEVKRVYLEQSGEKRVKELQEEIRSLEQKVARLNAKRAGIVAQSLFLESIRVSWGERISKELAIGRPTTAELQEASGFIGAGVTKAEEQYRDIDFEKSGLTDRIDALQLQQRDAAGTNRKEVKYVEVAIEVTRPGTLTLGLTAMIYQAGWEPAYDVRLTADAKGAELTFRAMVRQQTGEEWNSVDLTLSTARPAIGGAPPGLLPWHVSLYRPQPIKPAAPVYMSRKSVQMDSRMLESAVEMSASGETAPVGYETARVDEEQIATTFHVPRALDIPSDGTRHSTVVAIEKLPVVMEYLAVPKLSPAVYLRSEIVNQSPYPLLPGRVNTFVGSSFTGSSHLKKVAAGEKFDLYFGSDDQLTVKREELKQHKEAGLFGKNRVIYRYKVTLGNFRKQAVTLTLQDQLPVAGDEEIKVSLEEPSLKPEEIKTDGTIIWKTPLLAGEKKDLTFGILVEYPKEREINGL
jgi:uncharacterized protein (TIGR02231 family)